MDLCFAWCGSPAEVSQEQGETGENKQDKTILITANNLVRQAAEPFLTGDLSF